MNQGFAQEQALVAIRPTGKRELKSVDVAEVPAPQGEFILPAVNEVRLALALSDCSSIWHSSRGLLSKHASAGSISICEKRQGFQSGPFLLDGIAVALASHLVHCYSADTPVMTDSVGGMAPSILRRCIALIEARLEGDLALRELASEAGLSTSHFIRSFGESTGKTPYQFLLERRVQRAQTLMRDPHASLAEVARSTGFANQHHMARVFRRITGTTPSTYGRSL